ncbi:mandelate racemase/muconate lactonizing enzyme family protein [Thermodesulfobacteriota bacterium]
MKKYGDESSESSSIAYENEKWDISIRRLETFVFRAPIDIPVKTSFGVMNDRPAVLIRIEDKDGAFGWGEVWCNFPGCGAEHRARLAETVLAPYVLETQVIRSAYDDLTEMTYTLALQTGEFGPLAQIIAGLDIAVWDLAARREGVPLYRLLGGQHNKSIPVYASGINPDKAPATVDQCRRSGYSAFKLKVGFGRDSDLANIRAIVNELLPGELFMVDANQAWDLETAQNMINELSNFPISWVEEPIKADRAIEEWIFLAKSSFIPLAAGENLYSKKMFERVINSKSIAVIQPDVCKWGGLTGCRWGANETVNVGLRYCPHYLGGGVGLMASAHLLLAVGGDGLHEIDINTNPLREGLAQPFPGLSQGVLTLTDAPGLGVEPSMDMVRGFLLTHKDLH